MTRLNAELVDAITRRSLDALAAGDTARAHHLHDLMHDLDSEVICPLCR